MPQQLGVWEGSGPAAPWGSRRIQVSGTSGAVARWAGDKLTWRGQAARFGFLPSRLPQRRGVKPARRSRGGVWPRIWVSPGWDGSPFPIALLRRREVGEFPNLCFSCCLFRCRNIKTLLQPKKTRQILSCSHASVSVDVNRRVRTIYLDLCATVTDVLTCLR